MPGLFFCRCHMAYEFENQVLSFIRTEQLFGDRDKLLLAVSGGADSIALLHTLWALRADRHIKTELLCAHLNHKLRGAESEADETFVISQATGLGLDVVTRRLDVKRYAARGKLSIETAARKWRLETLCEIAKRHGCACIATGHHKNDNAETIIQRLLRGTGFRGLAGIHPRRRFEGGACFIRPLLCVSREQIQQYLKSRSLAWRQDLSNLEVEFRRNFIRHHLLPKVQRDCSQPIIEQLWQLSCRMRKFQDYLERQAEPLWHKLAKPSAGRVSIDLPGFLKQPEPVKIELIRRTLAQLGSGERDLTGAHLNRIIDLANQNVSNRVLELPDGFTFWREYKKLVFAAPRRDSADEELAAGRMVELKIPGRTHFGGFVIKTELVEYDGTGLESFKADKNSHTEWFDYDKLKLPLTVRFRRDGDKFVPLGMKNEKKVGQLLTDAQVPQEVRNNVLIISDARKIIWVWPIRISEQVKVTDKTVRILQLSISAK
jgi:tRNA(Ile)-lysidine synthase